MNILVVSIAPVFIISFYIYFRDKYEKEPFVLLIKSLLAGAIIVLPIVYLQRILGIFSANMNFYPQVAYNAFIVAAFSEELFKFAALYYLIWKNPEFNEKFDGIVYASFISLGFAAIENINYVFIYGINTGYLRAFTAVPAHALFGISMGFYFGMARFYKSKRTKYLFLSLTAPILLHGIYDFILFAKFIYMLFIFIPFIIYLWINGFRKMKYLSDISIFRNSNQS